MTEYSTEQNLRLSQKLLEQQGEINRLNEALTNARRSDMLITMLKQQLELQRNSMNMDPLTMNVTERVRYVKDMIFALEHELHEAADETTWKPWTVGEDRINEDAYFGELVDVWHFLMNLFLVAYQIPAEDLAYRLAGWYDRKRAINVQRRANGYDGKNKCEICGRALDDPAVTCSITESGTKVCNDPPIGT